MKEKYNISVLKKLVIVFVVIVNMCFGFSGSVEATVASGVANGTVKAAGGVLADPIADFILYVGDSIMDIIHNSILKQENTTIALHPIKNAAIKILKTVFFVVIAAAAVYGMIVAAPALTAWFAAKGIELAAMGLGTLLVAAGVGGMTGYTAVSVISNNLIPDAEFVLPIYRVTPERIFSNDILLFDVDFFNPKEDELAKDKHGNTLKDSSGNDVVLQSTAKELRGVIADWYFVLRNIAAVALLSILVYVGIRMIISSNLQDKSKYKKMITDWVVALCLLFIMHYIMSFSNYIIGSIMDFVTSIQQDTNYSYLIEDEGKDMKISEAYKKVMDEDMDVSEGYASWSTDLTGLARIKAQLGRKNSGEYLGYSIMYGVLVFFTCFFVWTYLRRVIYMAFLTVIAPFVAMTYPLDKIKDGQAQAFNMWVKEYIFNLLIQPMHFLLYSVLIKSAFSIAGSHIIYSLAALAFMMPAEKLLRKFFGFEKAQTPGVLAGPAGAALAMGAMNKILNKGSSKASGGKGNNNSGNSEQGDSQDDLPGRLRESSNFDRDEALFGQGRENTEETRALGDGNNNGENEQQLNNNDSPLGNENEELDQAGLAWQSYLDEINDDENNEDNIQEYNPEENYIGENSSSNNTANNQQEENADNSNINESGNIADLSDEQKKQLRKQRRKMLTRYYGRSLKKQFKKNLGKSLSNAPIKFARSAAGLAMGAATGALGTVAGIASGDPNKIIQNTTAGFAAGRSFGRSVVNAGYNLAESYTPDDINEYAQRLSYDSDQEYEKAKEQRAIQQFIDDPKNRLELEREYGVDRANEIAENHLPQLLEYGVNDLDEIKRVEEMIDSGKINNVEEVGEMIENGISDFDDMEAIFNMRNESDPNKKIDNVDVGIAYKKYASQMKEDPNNMTEKKRQEWIETFEKKFARNSKYEGLNHREMAERVVLGAERFNSAKNSVIKQREARQEKKSRRNKK